MDKINADKEKKEKAFTAVGATPPAAADKQVEGEATKTEEAAAPAPAGAVVDTDAQVEKVMEGVNQRAEEIIEQAKREAAELKKR